VDTSRKVKQRDEGLLDRGRDAATRQAWDEAYGLLAEADREAALDPSDLELLADAAYLSGRPDTSLEAWERVHESRLKEGDRLGAVAAAVEWR
jgi:hypothetical protein